MKIFLIMTIMASSILFLSGCSADLSDYSQEKHSPQKPTLDIKTYFTGDIIAWGMVQDYSAKVTRRFCVEINGQWTENKGVLAEKFYFDDGEFSVRNWQLTKLPDGRYEGSAGDVKGIAQGQQKGFAFHWQYDLSVPIDGETYVFSMDDWMYQIDEHRLFNRTTMNKLGIALAEITLFFDKEAPNKRCSVVES